MPCAGSSELPRIWKPPAWHRVLPGPSGPEPQKSPKRVRKGVPGPPGPWEPQSPRRVRPEVRKESKNTASDSFWTLFGLRGALFGDPGAPRGRRPRDTLSDSFRTLLGFRARRAREHSVPGRGLPNPRTVCLLIAFLVHKLRAPKKRNHKSPRFLTAGFLYRAGAELSRKIPSCSHPWSLVVTQNRSK